jgi:hypothetical protein
MTALPREAANFTRFAWFPSSELSGLAGGRGGNLCRPGFATAPTATAEFSRSATLDSEAIVGGGMFINLFLLCPAFKKLILLRCRYVPI